MICRVKQGKKIWNYKEIAINCCINNNFCHHYLKNPDFHEKKALKTLFQKKNTTVKKNNKETLLFFKNTLWGLTLVQWGCDLLRHCSTSLLSSCSWGLNPGVVDFKRKSKSWISIVVAGIKCGPAVWESSMLPLHYWSNSAHICQDTRYNHWDGKYTHRDTRFNHWDAKYTSIHTVNFVWTEMTSTHEWFYISFY